MNFKVGDIFIDTRDGDRCEVIDASEHSFFEDHITVKILSSKNPQYIGLNIFAPKNKLQFEKSRDKSHPLTNIFK